MITYISMLRGINVGGLKKLRMETLREIYEDLGFKHVQTYVQSGNVVFQSLEGEPRKVNQTIEGGIAQACGYAVEVFVRQPEYFHRIIMGNPFLDHRHEDPTKLHVTFLYQPVSETAWGGLSLPGNTSDEFARGEMAAYLFCPNGYGKTKLSTSFFERKLGVPVTTRNWNTVNALYKLAMEDQSDE
jgi:uncharacterized protein (DUF1697 family)